MLHHAGFLTGLSKQSLDGMIDVVKGIERESGYEAILKVSEAEAAMRKARIRRAKTVWALDLVARRFAEIKASNTADALAFIASSKCTNEESYLMQKLARGG